jgi:hypothetical protein
MPEPTKTTSNTNKSADARQGLWSTNKTERSHIKETCRIKRQRHSENNQVLYNTAIMNKSLQNNKEKA